jgi:hypothetical protein
MVRLLSGGLERADHWSAEQPRSRFFALTSLQAGVAEVRNPTAGIGLRLAWDLEVMPYAWVWHELRSSGGRWRGAAQLLMIEPSSVPHSLGLEAAINSGDCHWASRSEAITSRVRATVFFDHEAAPQT